MNIKAEREKQLIERGANWIDEQGAGDPDVVIILGSGLGNQLVNEIEIDLEIDMKDIPGLVLPTAPSHKKKIFFGQLGNCRVAVITGRLHYYEGYNGWEIVRPLRMISWLGTKNIIITNAAGGLNEDMKPGDIMVIEDHINLQGRNPLIGPNIELLGKRFPMIAHAYNPNYIQMVDKISKQLNINIHYGVYASVLGPSFETGAETKMLKLLGADAVGMSTVSEVIASAHLGMNILGFSVITNVNIPHVMSIVDEKEVIKVAKKGGRLIEGIIINFLRELIK